MRSVSNELNGRLTLRLPRDLLQWIREQGGSGYVRELLLERRKAPVQLKPPIQPDSVLREQWEQLVDERECLEDDRELLDEKEKLLDRHRDRLDKKRLVLENKREQLEDEWYELEQLRSELETRQEALTAAVLLLSSFPSTLFLSGGSARV